MRQACVQGSFIPLPLQRDLKKTYTSFSLLRCERLWERWNVGSQVCVSESSIHGGEPYASLTHAKLWVPGLSLSLSLPSACHVQRASRYTVAKENLLQLSLPRVKNCQEIQRQWDPVWFLRHVSNWACSVLNAHHLSLDIQTVCLRLGASSSSISSSLPLLHIFYSSFKPIWRRISVWLKEWVCQVNSIFLIVRNKSPIIRVRHLVPLYNCNKEKATQCKP